MERAYREHGDVLRERRQSDASGMDGLSARDKVKELIHGEHV
jgi:hypothetical protein